MNSIIEAQITLKEEVIKLWEGIEEYERPSIESQNVVTGIVEAADNRFLLMGLQRRRPENKLTIEIDHSYLNHTNI